jgi:hypothetical protein
MIVWSRCLDSTNILGSFLGHADALGINLLDPIVEAIVESAITTHGSSAEPAP